MKTYTFSSQNFRTKLGVDRQRLKVNRCNLSISTMIGILFQFWWGTILVENCPSAAKGLVSECVEPSLFNQLKISSVQKSLPILITVYAASYGSFSLCIIQHLFLSGGKIFTQQGLKGFRDMHKYSLCVSVLA